MAIRPYLLDATSDYPRDTYYKSLFFQFSNNQTILNLYGLAPIPVPYCLQSAGTNKPVGWVGPKNFYLNFLLSRPCCLAWPASVNLKVARARNPKKNERSAAPPFQATPAPVVVRRYVVRTLSPQLPSNVAIRP